jgi:hypothetical protein
MKGYALGVLAGAGRAYWLALVRFQPPLPCPFSLAFALPSLISAYVYQARVATRARAGYPTFAFIFSYSADYRMHLHPTSFSYLNAGLMFESLLDSLESELRAALNTSVTGLVATAWTRLEEAVAEVARERAKGLLEVAQERAVLHREIEAMQAHHAKQEGRVELNIGGYRFEMSVETLRRVPHTFSDAYFSGRYAQDV